MAEPHIVGHRGASGYRPEHTLASYALAAYLGADFMEPDLVTTRDGVLVCRHESEISGTTDVAQRPDLADRRTTRSVDGEAVTGWFVEDLTLAELRTLRAVERLPQLRQHNTAYDGLWSVPTFEELLQLREQVSERLGREVGVYPETKHPTYFRELGLPLEEPMVELLRRYGLDRRDAPVYLQSFELSNLQALRSGMGVQARLVFLTSPVGGPFNDERTYAELVTREGMATYAADIDGLGPHLHQVIATDEDGALAQETGFVADAHANGLTVCPWTVRAENAQLPLNYQVGSNERDFGRALDYLQRFFAAGVDGIFTDMPDLGHTARELFLRSNAG